MKVSLRTKKKSLWRQKPKLYRFGVGVMLFNYQGLIFAGERKKISNAWQMPQGGIDKGETPYQAMLRELYEETGIRQQHIEIIKQTEDWLHYDLPPNIQRRLWQGKYIGQKQKWYLCRFVGRDEDVNIKAHRPCEFIEWNWLATDDLMSMAVDFKQELYKKIFTRFMPEMAKCLA
ncbi:MAG: RNA pyrophosphohydrolase [Alphaproteobacteria bacterium]